ncbi:MAG: cyclic nucleotide-binding domain-containing protein [Giesbergeria sp.]
MRTFTDLDRALEWAEVAILAQRPLEQRPARGDSGPLGEIGEGMHREARLALEALLLPYTVPPQGVVFSAGDRDRDRDLLVVDAGPITLCTQWPPERGLRLATVGPGMVFGEIAFLNGAERSACAGAERSAARLMRLPRERFDGWARQYPEAGLILMENLAQMGARRLTVATRQRRSVLEQ